MALFLGLLATSGSALVWSEHATSVGEGLAVPWARTARFGIFLAEGVSYADARREYEARAVKIARTKSDLDLGVYVAIWDGRAIAMARLQRCGYLYLALLTIGIVVAAPAVSARTRTPVRFASLLAGCVVSMLGLWAYFAALEDWLVTYAHFDPEEPVLALTAASRVRLGLWGALGVLTIAAGATAGLKSRTALRGR